MANLWNKELGVRTLSGLIFLIVIVGGTLLSPYLLLAILIAVCVGSMLEFYKLAGLSGANPQRILSLAIGELLVLSAFAVKLQWVDSVFLLLFLPLVFLLIIVEIYRKSETPFTNIGWSLLGIVYIALPLAFLAALPLQPGGEWRIAYSPFMVLNIFFIVWANDVGAYLFGVTFGKHRLLERISPKKSWEGCIGGLLCAVGVGMLLAWLQHLPLWVWAGAALVTAIAAVYGDLAESMLKRSVGVKDSGRAIPGHGGFLDRFDAMFVAVPFVFVYLTIFA